MDGSTHRWRRPAAVAPSLAPRPEVARGWQVIALASTLVGASAGCDEAHRVEGTIPVPRPPRTVTAEPRPEPARDTWIEERLVAAEPSAAAWLAEAAALRLQVLVTLVDRSADGPPRLEEHAFRADAEYFYPASAIKPFLAVAALRHVRQLAEARGARGGPETSFMICAARSADCTLPAGPSFDADAEGPGRKHRLDEELRALLHRSDNDAFDRLYDLTGPEVMHAQWAAMGFPDVRVRHRLGTPAMRTTVRRVRVFLPDGLSILLPSRDDEPPPEGPPAVGFDVGHAHVTEDGRRRGPMRFEAKNQVSLADLHRLLRGLVLGDEALGLAEDDRRAVLKPMKGWPRPGAPPTHKPLAPGVAQPGVNLRYVSKAGRAYGFHVENAYVEAPNDHRALFVTAVIHANPNRVVGDGDYAYAKMSMPFYAALGRALSKATFGGPGEVPP